MLSHLHLAVRLLLKSPGFTPIAVLTLGLGIGANTAIFSFINTFFFKSLPFERPEELVSAYTLDERNPGFLPISPPNFADYRDHNQVFTGMGGSFATLIIRRSVLVAAAGLFAGVATALALTRYVGSFLFAVSPTDPLTFVAISALLTAVTLLDCYLPARRAPKVDPLVAHRTE